MATIRTAHTQWHGSLEEGTGEAILFSSGAGTFDVTEAARSGAAQGRTGPEELIAAALSTCFSMGLSDILTQDGNAPEHIETFVHITFEPGEGIKGMHVEVNGTVAGISDEDLASAAEKAMENSTVNSALTGFDISLETMLA